MSESDRVSEKWVKAINKKCAGVLVPCPQLVEIYQQSGVKVPVYDVGCGVDYFVPKYNLNKAPKKINFLTYSYGDMRKGAHLAIVAFKRLFGNKPKYQLWVKSRVSKGSWLAGCKDEQIKLWSGEYTESRWFDLLQNVQGFVFPSYGEGFGLPPREAALAGTPAIATQWLGLWDVQEWGYPVRVKRMLPAQFDFWEANEQGALWAEADVDHLAEQMEWVAENPALAKEKARAGRDYLLDNFTWAKTARRIIEVISLERKDNGDHSATNH
jgi:glycosyltransferase involved in cell wall biosynthesis